MLCCPPPGIYRDAGFDSYVSLLRVPELSQVSKTSSSVTLGAAVSLSRLVEELQLLAPTTGFRHFSDMASHLLVVANTPVRNAGSWAGNLMLKHAHNEFPSDVFLLLAAAGGRLQIGTALPALNNVRIELHCYSLPVLMLNNVRIELHCYSLPVPISVAGWCSLVRE